MGHERIQAKGGDADRKRALSTLLLYPSKEDTKDHTKKILEEKEI